MRILLLTQYFPPETGAPQNRLSELALRLRNQGVEIEVLTAMPNYPKYEIFEGYKGKKYVLEDFKGIPVHRTWIYTKKTTSIFHRLLNYFSFITSSLVYAGRVKGKFDFVLFESPPLFLGWAAWLLAVNKDAKLIMNVSDLWPESAEKLGLVSNKFFLKMAYRLESWLYKKSVLVTGQTMGIVNDIKNRFPSVDVYWLKNGVDPGYYDPEMYDRNAWREKHGISEDEFVILYAGIIGHAQGLEIIPRAAGITNQSLKIRYVMVGDGPEKPMVEKLAAGIPAEQLLILPPVDKQEMPLVVAGSDAALVPLKKLDLFKGAIPSKIFENLAMEKPVLLGVDGEAKDLFINQACAGYYFEPENPVALVEVAEKLAADKVEAKRLGERGRQFVLSEFNRDRIAADLLVKLQEALRKRRQ